MRAKTVRRQRGSCETHSRYVCRDLPVRSLRERKRPLSLRFTQSRQASKLTNDHVAKGRARRGVALSGVAAFAGACRFAGSGPDFPQVDDVQIPYAERQARPSTASTIRSWRASPVTTPVPRKEAFPALWAWPNRRLIFLSPAANTPRSSSRESSRRATWCSASGGRFSSRRCRSSAAATPSGTSCVYMTYSDKLIEGSPKNSTSTVPIQPWGAGAGDVEKCADFLR